MMIRATMTCDVPLIRALTQLTALEEILLAQAVACVEKLAKTCSSWGLKSSGKRLVTRSSMTLSASSR